MSLVGLVSSIGVYKGLTPERMAANKAVYAKSAAVKNEISYFRDKIAKVTTVDGFLKDYRLLKFALTAYDMESQLDYPARIKTILKDDPSDSGALVNRMTSSDYKLVNKDFDFFKSGIAKLKDSAFIEKLIEKYNSASYENSLGQLSPAVADAIYFERKIGAIKDGYGVIGDPILFDVVRIGLSFPQGATAAKIERLKLMVEEKLDMTRLNDTAYVKNIVQRYLALKDVENMRSQGNGLLDMFA